MTGVSYATSAEMARELGTFPGYAPNREAMLRVIRNHRRAAHGETTEYEQLSTPPVPLDHASCPDMGLIAHACAAWNRALELGHQFGYRNAQVSVIAPTGTIGLVMDCDTTGIEPDFALVKFKKLAGGGYFKIINRAVPEALRTLGYSESQIAEIEAYAVGHATLSNAPSINHSTLASRGLDEATIKGIEEKLATAFDIKFVFNRWTLGDAVLEEAQRLRRAAGEPAIRSLGASRLRQARGRGREPARLRGHDLRRRPAPEARAPAGVRLRQSVRPPRQAVSVGREPYPHDGGGAAVHLRCHLQDHQHAERGDGGSVQGELHALLAAGAESQRALPRRLEARRSPWPRS